MLKHSNHHNFQCDIYAKKFKHKNNMNRQSKGPWRSAVVYLSVLRLFHDMLLLFAGERSDKIFQIIIYYFRM